MLCREQQRFESDIGESVLLIEGLWLKTEAQLESLRAIWKTLQPALQVHYTDALERLERKIVVAVEGVQHIRKLRATDANTYQKLKALQLKKYLKKTVLDLEDWQRRFDPSWYLITRIANPQVDKQLKDGVPNQSPSTARLARMREAIKEAPDSDCTGSIFINASSIKSYSHVIPGTNTFVAMYQHTARTVILDRTSYNSLTAPMTAKTYVRDLARLLLNIDPMTFGLLKCEGVIEVPDKDGVQFQFVLEVPRGLSSPKSLRTLLMETPRCSLSHRIQLAKQLARSVMFVHTAGFVHKNIRPETILVFADDFNPLGPSFLSGFERVRRSGAPTEQSGDLEWEKNLYRHPARQGLWPEELYIMQHDIYSLGVCLLELALGQSFVHYNDDTASPWEELDISEAMSDKDRRRGAFAIKRGLVAMTEDRLPSLIGDRYTKLTVACLNCLNGSNDNTFGTQSELMDKDGIIVGVRYIEKVSQLVDERNIC